MEKDKGWDRKDRAIFIIGISLASILMVAMGIKSGMDRIKCNKAYDAYMEYLEREGIDPKANALDDVCMGYCNNPDAPNVPTNCKMYCNIREVTN